MRRQKKCAPWVSPLTLSLAIVVATPGSLAAAGAVTAAECEAFGRQIEQHAARGDFAYYADAIDWGALIERSVPPGILEPKDYEEIKYVMSKGARERAEVLAKSYIVFKFLRTKQVGQEMRVLCRFELTGSGFMHQELIIDRGSNGQPRIVDTYLYLFGEKLSDVLRPFALPLIARKNKSAAERLAGNASEFVEAEPVWFEMARLLRSGRYLGVLVNYDQLPTSVQKDKFLLWYRLKAAQALDDEDYLKTVDLWRHYYPDDVSSDMVSLDALTLRKQYAEALRCVDRLDKALGGDPYLDVHRAYLWILMNDPARAKAAAQRAFEAEPTRLDAGLCVLSLLATEDNDDECVAWLNKMQSAGGLSKDRLAEEIETSHMLLRFPVSQAYLKWRGPKKPPSPLVIGKSRTETDFRSLKLQGILYAKSRPGATINGQYVVVGDSIGEYKVRAIDAESVTLESMAGEKKLIHVGEMLGAVQTREEK